MTAADIFSQMIATGNNESDSVTRLKTCHTKQTYSSGGSKKHYSPCQADLLGSGFRIRLIFHDNSVHGAESRI